MTTDRETVTERRRPVASAFESREHADRALGDLRNSGFKDDEVGWAMRHEEAPEGTKDVSDDVAAGATAGAVTGGLLGAAGAAAGMALIPGLGPFIAGGYLATILTTAGASAAAGGILGGLAGMFGDEDEGKFYEEEFRAGRPVMTVNAGDREEEAREIFRRSGGYDYQSRRAAAGGTTTTTGTTGGTGTTGSSSTIVVEPGTGSATTSGDAGTMRGTQDRTAGGHGH